ncbi:efflux RND transporter periplasmic adaptor subunit [Lacunimicrobium album]
MRVRSIVKYFAFLSLTMVVVAGGYVTRDRWMPLLSNQQITANQASLQESSDATEAANTSIIVNEVAQENLGLKSKPLKPAAYWKTIQVPGMVIDLPGQSDRGIVTPATGVVTSVVHFPSESVKTGEMLFTVKLLSESLLLTQSDLFKSTQNIVIAQAQKERLATAGSALPESRRIEVENEITRLQIASQAYRQELQNRGLSTDAINRIASGDFVSEIQILVPPPLSSNDGESVDYEIQTLDVTLGQQVQAGQTLCTLANHRRLAVEGYAFRDETSLLERTVMETWPVEIDFLEQVGDWPALPQKFLISHVANTIDPQKRTFAFRIPLENQSRHAPQTNAEEDSHVHTQTLWRFRPGQKVKVLVKVDLLENVFVIPSDAIAMDGPEAFVFMQNVNTFIRKPVRLVMRDRQNVVIANDGSILPGTYVIQSGAEQLNRMVKSGGSSGVPKGYHIHADGSLHKNEDEGK